MFNRVILGVHLNRVVRGKWDQWGKYDQCNIQHRGGKSYYFPKGLRRKYLVFREFFLDKCKYKTVLLSCKELK